MKVESTDEELGRDREIHGSGRCNNSGIVDNNLSVSHPNTGSVTVNTAPLSGEFAASTLPLCSFITDLQILRPSPVPRPGRFVV